MSSSEPQDEAQKTPRTSARRSSDPGRGTGSIEVPKKPGTGLDIPLLFTRGRAHPFDETEWERRDAIIEDERGKIVFAQRNVEFPRSWSTTASQIVASKYFHGQGEAREDSLRQLPGCLEA